MDRFPAPLDFLTHRQTLAWLLVPVLFFPIAATILSIFGRIFALLNDTLSASILDYTALALALLWCLSLVLLLLCAVFRLLREESDAEQFHHCTEDENEEET
jgi:predicted ferric reductase